MKLDLALQANLLIFHVMICSRILHFCVPLSHEGKRTKAMENTFMLWSFQAAGILW